MSNYFSQFIPSFGNAKDNQETLPEIVQAVKSKLNYLLIINPKLVNPDQESNEELIKQNICYISDNDTSLMEKLKVIGLIRGIDSFGREFTDNDTTNPTIIQSSKSSIVVINVEQDYYIACSIILPTDDEKYGYINNQLIKLINQAYRKFAMLHNTFEQNVKSGELSSVNQFWFSFFDNFNHQNYVIPVNWPNGLNYRGFLGLLPKNTYKRSSMNFGSTSQQEIDMILQGTSSFIPKGIVIAYLNKSNPKKYGLIYKNSLTINDDNLIEVYNWLEFYDYQNKLSTKNLVSNDITEEFHSDSVQIEQELEPLFQTATAATTAASTAATTAATAATTAALDMLTTINLTNNLVVSPLNYTVNGMKSLHGMFINSNDPNSASTIGATNQTPPEPQPYSWLTIPPVLKNFRFGATETIEPDTDTEIEIPGEYLIGLKPDDEGNKIYKKSFYFHEVEHSLVIYCKNDIYITLIFESNVEKLDNPKFYQTLQEEILDPSIEEINQTCLNASVNGSLASLKSLNKYLQTPLDSDFFFVIYDVDEGWFKSSLPYLPLKSNSKLNNAMIYLHDQLTGLFIIKNNRDFFCQDNLMNEYFHKFTSNKSNDWMFYYIRHRSKIILIIKNQNRNKPTKKIQSEEPGLMGKFTTNVNLGFLDNLGDDVKSWLEIFNTNGEL